jgi:hypothetical protein
VLEREFEGGSPGTAVLEKLGLRGSFEVRRIPGGGNNRIYRVDGDGRTFALKQYPLLRADWRQRMNREVSAFRLLRQHDVASVPAAVAADPESGFALFEWIVGSAPNPAIVAADDIQAVLHFMTDLLRISRLVDRESLSGAAEDCLSASCLVEQITRRRAALANVATSEPMLRQLLGARFERLLARALFRLDADYRRFGWADELPIEARTLSPSDFGMHNALRRSDGSLAFIDFEYFGWDDPVKLVSDFAWHPAMRLSTASAHTFFAGARRLYAGDPVFDARLAAQMALYGLRWFLILLNEFLPDRWRGRAYARDRSDWEAVKAEQSAKAAPYLDRVELLLAGLDEGKDVEWAISFFGEHDG